MSEFFDLNAEFWAHVHVESAYIHRATITLFLYWLFMMRIMLNIRTATINSFIDIKIASFYKFICQKRNCRLYSDLFFSVRLYFFMTILQNKSKLLLPRKTSFYKNHGSPK